MGQGAKGVSNLLMGAVAGRNMSMTNRQTRARECKPLSCCVQLKPRGRQKGQTGHHLQRNVLEGNINKIKKKKEEEKRKAEIIQRKYLVQHLPLWNQTNEFAFVKILSTGSSSSSYLSRRLGLVNNMMLIPGLPLPGRSKLTRVLSARIVLVSRNQFLSG